MPEKLAEILSLHLAEVEEVKEERPAGGYPDFVLDIDVRPNRASDCFSHIGIAREISAITGLKFIEPSLKLKEDPEGKPPASYGAGKSLKTKNFVAVEVRNKTVCPRYTARVFSDVKIGLSPKWIRDRLKVCGLRPINNVVDIANYVMLETGQPLHAFDFEKLESVNPKSQIKKLIIRFAKKNEKIVTLDNEKYDLDDNILIIADEAEPLAIAGIKGGKKAEIDNETKIVVLESANFNSRIIRKSSKTIDLKTDASLRFEHGIDPNLTEFAINRAAYLIQKLAKGKVAQGTADFYPQKVLPQKIRLDLDYVEKLLGIKIPEKEIKNILQRLGLKIVNCPPSGGLKILNVVVPTFRLDVSIPEDLIEEIGRIYGYDKIKAVFPIASLIPPPKNLDIFWEDFAKNILKEAGFCEVYNYSFISPQQLSTFNFHPKTETIEVENPLSEEQKYLRPSLIPNLLKNVRENQKNFREIRIFELGKIFKKPKEEKRRLSGLITGEEFYQLKGTVDSLLNKLGISNIWYAEPRSELCSTTGDEYQPTPEETNLSVWHPKKCAEIKIDREEIGFLGEISPRILDNLEIQGKVVLFDIDFEKLSKLASEEHEYRPISPYPAAIRDIAVLVPPEVRVEEVLNKIEGEGGKIIRDVDLFDIYEGEELPQGKKNLAFHIIYQAEDKTLSSKEIDELQDKIIKTLEENPEWQVRK